ncbi:MAG: hypothetical protein K2N10_08905, partial [Muribaculaceae bacterium]|nr:hypothetical protein [Muribaculaceae bacterium]
MLSRAESIMEQQPDSALALLETIDGATLSGERRARHALLLSQAYDKNYIDLTDDSLISIAVKHYEQTDDRYHKMLAYQYQGTVQKNAQQYGLALHAALKAHDEADALADTLNLARIESMLGRIYVMAYNFKEGLRWDSMALEKAKQLNNSIWIQMAYENIAAEHLSMAQYEEALQYADSAVAVDQIPSSRMLGIKYRAYFGLKMDDKADSILSVMYDMGITPNKEINDVLDYYKERDTEETIAYLNKAIRDMNEYVVDIFERNLSASLTQYLDDKSRRLNDEIARKRAQNITLACFGVMIIAILSLLLFAMRLRAKNHRIQSENAIHALSADYDRMRREVESNKAVIFGLRQGVDRLSQQAAESRQSYMAIRRQASVAFMQRFSWVNKLGDLYLDANLSNGESEKKLYKKVAEELRSARRESFVAEIEKVCREQNPDLWNEIRSLNLIQSEREMLLLFVTGMSPRVIGLITGRSGASIYSIK